MHKYRTVTLHISHWRVLLAGLRVARTASHMMPDGGRTRDSLDEIITIIQEQTYT